MTLTVTERCLEAYITLIYASTYMFYVLHRHRYQHYNVAFNVSHVSLFRMSTGLLTLKKINKKLKFYVVTLVTANWIVCGFISA